VRIGLSILASIAIVAVRGASTEPPASTSSIVSQMPCPFTTFDEQSGFTKRFYSKDEFDSAKRSTTVECLKIQYLSDGLKVVGFIVRPNIQGKRYPVILYNRGGFGEMGKIDTWNLLDFYRFASSGFTVLASQYRGNDGGEGRDEVGGADVNDVINLMSLAATLPYVDTNNVFLYGLSRGGMMTLLTLKRGIVVNAAAVLGAVFDLEPFQQRAPGIFEHATKLIPDYPSRGAETLKERSAMNWPERVTVPLLIMQGGDDQEVPASEALAFASKLSALHKVYELVVYAEDIHEAAHNRLDRDARIIAWFQRYRR